MTGEELIKTIEEAYALRDYSKVLFLSTSLTAEQRTSSVASMQGVAGVHQADFGLAGRMFEDALKLPHDGGNLSLCYIGLAYVQDISGYHDLAIKTIQEGKKSIPELLSHFDEIYDVVGIYSKSEYKEEFRKMCELVV